MAVRHGELWWKLDVFGHDGMRWFLGRFPCWCPIHHTSIDITIESYGKHMVKIIFHQIFRQTSDELVESPYSCEPSLAHGKIMTVEGQILRANIQRDADVNFLLSTAPSLEIPGNT